MSDRGKRGDAGERPGYVIAVCEGAACVPAVPIPGAPLWAAVGWLTELAARFRAKGLLGRVALLDGCGGGPSSPSRLLRLASARKGGGIRCTAGRH